MRTETSTAFARLVTTYANALDATGAQLPDELERQLSANPLKACELLNELALSANAIDERTDATLAAIYEAMDAVDARTDPDEEGRIRITQSLARARQRHEAAPQAQEVECPPKEAGDGRTAAERDERDRSADVRDVDDETVATGGKARQTTKNRPGRHSRALHAQQTRGESRDASEARTPDAQSALDASGGPVTDAVPPAPDATLPTPGEPLRHAESNAGDRRASRPKRRAHASVREETAGNAEGHRLRTFKVAADSVDRPAKPKEGGEAAQASPTDVLTVDQTMAVLGVSRPTVYKLIEGGKLPAFKKGRSWQVSAPAVAELAASKS